MFTFVVFDMINKVILVGNVGQDPDVRVMQSGMKVANFAVATSESWKDKNGEKKENTEWHRIVVYGDKLPEIIEKYVKKGTKLYVEGSIRSRKYTDTTGQERTVFEIIVQNFGGTIKILDSRNSHSTNEHHDDSGSNEPQKTNNNDRIDQSVHIDDEIPF